MLIHSKYKKIQFVISITNWKSGYKGFELFCETEFKSQVNYQLKIDSQNTKFYVIPMVTTKKIPTEHTQKKWERNQSLSLQKKINETQKEGRKEKRDKITTRHTENNKMEIVSTLNVNGLKLTYQKTHWLNR